MPSLVLNNQRPLCPQVNLDGFALPVKKLKGTDPVETLDLSGKGLRVASALVIASLIGVNASLTKVWVRGNKFGDVGTISLCDALRESKVSKVEELDLSYNSIGVSGAKAVAAYCTVTTSLTNLS